MVLEGRLPLLCLLRSPTVLYMRKYAILQYIKDCHDVSRLEEALRCVCIWFAAIWALC